MQQLVISVIAGPAVISNSEMVGKEVEYVRAQQSQPVSDPVFRCSSLDPPCDCRASHAILAYFFLPYLRTEYD